MLYMRNFNVFDYSQNCIYLLFTHSFAMADSLCKPFDVALTARHLPVRPEGESALIVLPPSAMGKDVQRGWGAQVNRNRNKGWGAPVEMPKQEPVIINAVSLTTI